MLVRAAGSFGFAIAVCGCGAIAGLDGLKIENDASSTGVGGGDASAEDAAAFDATVFDASPFDAGILHPFDAGVVPDADGGAASEEAGTPDADVPETGAYGIACGGSAHCQTDQSCCVVTTASSLSYECAATSAACPAASPGGTVVALECETSGDCAVNLVCCISKAGSSATSTCAPSCSSTEAELCTPLDINNNCPLFVLCSASNIASWGLPSGSSFATCGGKSAP